MRQFGDAYASMDRAGLDAVLSDGEDLVLIGSSDLWIEDKSELLTTLEEEVATLSPTVRMDGLAAYEEGNIGWGSARVTLVLPNGLEAAGRWTTVLRREDGRWRLVHTHFSLSVPDEEAFRPPTTS